MKIKKFTIIIAIANLFTVLVSQLSFADSQDNYLELKEQLQPLMREYEENIPEVALTNCLEVLTPLFDMAALDFMQFLDTHYSNNASTSSLNNTAIAKFMTYKKYITDITLGITPKSYVSDGPTTLIKEYRSFLVCEGLASAYIELARSKMYDYSRSNVYIKKSAIVNETMVPINEEMRELLFSFAKMYGNFMTFRDKLPGFLTDCLTK